MAPEQKPQEQNPFAKMEEREIWRRFGQWRREELQNLPPQAKKMSMELDRPKFIGYLQNPESLTAPLEIMKKGKGIDIEAMKADEFRKWFENLRTKQIGAAA